MELSDKLVDLSDIVVKEVRTYQYMGETWMDVVGADMEDVLEAIGEDRVRKYFDIREDF